MDIFRGGAAIMRRPSIRVMVLLGLGWIHLLVASTHVMLLISILGLVAILAEILHLGMLLLLRLLEHIPKKILGMNR